MEQVGKRATDRLATPRILDSGDHRRRGAPMMDGLLPMPTSLCQVPRPNGDAHSSPDRRIRSGRGERCRGVRAAAAVEPSKAPSRTPRRARMGWRIAAQDAIEELVDDDRQT